MHLSIHRDINTAAIPRKRLVAVMERISRAYHIPSGNTINLIICDSLVIRRLNRTFRKKNRITDVLSFLYNEPDLLGEIYICGSRALRQAREFDHSYATELERLMVHGVFHLLGYDHGTQAERAIMEKHETQFCTIPWVSRSIA